MQYSATINTAIKPLWRKKALFFIAMGCVLTLFASTKLALTIEQHISLPLLFKQRGPIAPPENIGIVALNSKAHERLNLPGAPSTWPRTTIAEAITALKNAGAKLIVLDIAFRKAKSEPGDTHLEQAIKNAGNVILFTYLKREHIPLGGGLVDIEKAIPPLERFAKYALATGSFTLPKETHIFKTQLFTHSPPKPSQPLQAYHAVTQAPMHARLHQAPFYINFYGPAQTIKTWDIDKIVQPQSEASPNLKNTIVYIGYLESVQTEQMDTYPTVFSSDYGLELSGVEISATVLANLLDGSEIKPAQAKLRMLLIALMMCTVLIMQRLNRILFGACLAGTLVLTWYIGQQLFQTRYIWLPLGLLTFTAIGTSVALFINNYLSQRRNLGLVRTALQQHMPDHAARKLGQQIVTLEKEHQLAHGVCLVTDIRGYTALAETLPPEELHTLMNTYYAELVASVEQHGGFVGNIVGDSLLALWSGPEINTALCEQALAAVKTIQTRLATAPELHNKLPTCIGLHAGQFSLGHLGAKGHFEYSPVGDMINTATRIEHFNRTLGTEFLCSAPVAEHLLKSENAKDLCYLGAFNMRNKAQATHLYTLNDNNKNSLFA